MKEIISDGEVNEKKDEISQIEEKKKAMQE